MLILQIFEVQDDFQGIYAKTGELIGFSFIKAQ